MKVDLKDVTPALVAAGKMCAALDKLSRAFSPARRNSHYPEENLAGEALTELLLARRTYDREVLLFHEKQERREKNKKPAKKRKNDE